MKTDRNNKSKPPEFLAGAPESRRHIYIYIYIYIYYRSLSLSLYIYIYIYIYGEFGAVSGPRGPRLAVSPIRVTRFSSLWTQPLENLSAAVKLPIPKRFLGNPTLGTNLGQRILAMRTECTPSFSAMVFSTEICQGLILWSASCCLG